MQQPDITPQAPRAWKQWLLVSGIVVGSFALLNLGIWGMYQARAYPGVVIGGQAVGSLDQTAIVNQLDGTTTDYKLQVTVKDQTHEVSAADLDLVYNQKSSAQAAINQGKQFIIPLYGLIHTWQHGVVDLEYGLDDSKLEKLTTELAGTGTTPATDAKVVVEGETVRVEADKPGYGIDTKLLAEAIRKELAQGGHQVKVEEQATKAQVSTEEAEAMVPEVKQAMARSVTITVNNRIFTPGAAEIGRWITVLPDKDGKLLVGTNQDAVNAYVASVASQIDVAAVNKQINMVNGVVRTVNEGKNGSALDRAAVATALSQAVTTGNSLTVTGTMTPVVFKTRTNNSIELSGKYIEINLSRQHLWAYDNGRVVYDTPITSGATGAGFATIQGLFSVKAKQTNRNLNGVPLGFDYNVFVNYWMPFSGNYGMHDASWRSSFGGSDYYYNGSHGCVNLPAGAAAWVYNFVIVGTPVWVHS